MLLKILSELNGASGAEKAVRDHLRRELEPYADAMKIDKMGNLIAEKNLQLPGPKIMLAAHMDEVALMITDITSDGFLRFRPVGGIDPRILPAKTLKVGEKQINGIIGSKAIHLTKQAERNKALDFEQLYIDIGAASKEDAFRKVHLGDYAYFDTAFETLGEDHYKGKALDDRVGCAVLAELMKREYDVPLVYAFTVQEEIGLRGAKTAAYHVQPDFAIVLEGTIAGDMLDVEEGDWVTEVGKGPACSLMDSTTLYSPALIKWVAEIAGQNRIPLQFRRGSGGGNDAGVIHISRSGVPTLTLSVPCRYIHSFASIIAGSDLENIIELVDAILKELPARGIPNSGMRS